MNVGDSWPKRPYRGLDYYEEADAPLFRERDDDVRNCLRSLIAFRTKILLLQGSSGSGKSSFLRAGLITALNRLPEAKVPPRWTPVLLNVDNGVIRCTTDPLVAIGAALRRAMEEDSRLSPRSSGRPECGAVGAALEHATRKWIVDKLDHAALMSKTDAGALDHDEQASKEEYREFAKLIIEVLAKLSQSLEEKLFLFIDQAEEVLTRTTGTQKAKPPTKGFFYFLEELCFRDINLRVVVSLRTEYYGRFRDEFGISEQPFGPRERDSKKETGVEAFLLKPLRDEERLVRAFRYPTIAMRFASGDEVSAYPFNFDEGVLETIIRDVLDMPELGDGAVTPLISMICADLHSRLPNGSGTIRKSDYPGVEALLKAYLERGIGKVAQQKSGQALLWEELLFETLVSRQGGGMVVSMTEDIGTFVGNALKVGVEASAPSIRQALSALAHGDAPLLREAPTTDGESQYSLKHDAVAVILDRRREARLGSRREAERTRKEKQRAEEERVRAEQERRIAQTEATRARAMRNFVLVTAAIIIVGTAIILKNRSDYLKSVEEEKAANINLWADTELSLIRTTNYFVMRPINTKESDDIRILIYNMNVTDEAIAKSEARQAAALKIDLLRESYRETLKNLRNIVARSSRMTFRCLAFSYDSKSKRLACLERDRDNELKYTYLLRSYNLPAGDELNDESPDCYVLPETALPRAIQPWEREVVGYMGAAGLALYFDGRLYHWSGQKDVNNCHVPSAEVDLRWALELLGPSPFPPMAEFDNGWLTIRRPPLPPSGKGVTHSEGVDRATENKLGPSGTVKLLKFDASIFNAKAAAANAGSFAYEIPQVEPPTMPPRLFDSNGRVSFAYLTNKAEATDTDACVKSGKHSEHSNSIVTTGDQKIAEQQCGEVLIYYGSADSNIPPSTLQLAADWQFQPTEPQRWTFAFVHQNDAQTAAGAEAPLIAAKGPTNTVTFHRLLSQPSPQHAAPGELEGGPVDGRLDERASIARFGQ